MLHVRNYQIYKTEKWFYLLLVTKTTNPQNSGQGRTVFVLCIFVLLFYYYYSLNNENTQFYCMECLFSYLKTLISLCFSQLPVCFFHLQTNEKHLKTHFIMLVHLLLKYLFRSQFTTMYNLQQPSTSSVFLLVQMHFLCFLKEIESWEV